MIDFVWASDLHLDDCREEHIQQFLEEISQRNPQSLLISGDISNGLFVESHLDRIDASIHCPCYFVLGNHDYYYRSVESVRNQLKNKRWKHLRYLSQESLIPLSKKTALIGCDGWADGRAGNYFASPILIKDFQYIEDLKGLAIDKRWKKLQNLGDREAVQLEEKITRAFQAYEQLVIVTHVPPFEEVALYKGQSDPFWLPFMVCQSTGNAIESQLLANPDKQVLVLCGHSHSAVQKQLRPNLRVCVAGYQQIPVLQQFVGF